MSEVDLDTLEGHQHRHTTQAMVLTMMAGVFVGSAWNATLAGKASALIAASALCLIAFWRMPSVEEQVIAWQERQRIQEELEDQTEGSA